MKISDVSKISNIAHLGSVIETNSVIYYLSISAGQITVGNKIYFAISVSSPIGKLLLGKKMNDTFSFNGKAYQIQQIL